MQTEEELKWSPIEFGFGQREGQRIFYKQAFDLREIRPNVWLCRRKVTVNGVVEYLVKFLQYIPSDRVKGYPIAKALMGTYLYPLYDKEFNTDIIN